MKSDQYELLRRVFTEARSLPPEERGAFLDEACAGDRELRAEIEALLVHDSPAAHDLEAVGKNVLNVAARAAAERGADEAPGLGVPQTIGRFRVVRRIATGGMGAVYEAVQEHPFRRVALKTVRRGILTPSLQRRFRQETEMLGRLQHPGIGQIFEAGTFDEGEGPQPFFAMEFIDGPSLIEYAKTERLGVDARLQLVADVCDAVSHAHQKGVIHRDLKPDNILVVDGGLPKILDFGVARATDSDLRTTAVHTEAGQIIGTLPYMSPEQVQASPEDLDTRSDVYSLGVVLYELLVGRLPYDIDDSSIAEAVHAIGKAEPVRLGTLDSSLRGDIETIVGKALAKDKDRRYGSTAELAGDLRRYLAHEPITARPPSLGYVLRLAVSKRRALAATIAVALLLIVVSTVVSFLFVSNARNVAEDRLAAFERMADVKRLEDRLREARDDLWPATPAMIPAMEAWQRKSEALVSRIEVHRAERDRLREQKALAPRTDVDGPGGAGEGSTESIRWRFATDEDQWRHDTITALVAGLEEFRKIATDVAADGGSAGILSNVRERLTYARNVHRETIERHREAWEEAIASIRSEAECPRYAGLVIEPQLGLIPIGRDPSSGLWEFGWWRQTGEIPRRDDDGSLILEETSGMVFVLIPGGTFHMGASKARSRRAERQGESRNHDPLALGVESPVHEVTLAPFFLSKYEMTQGQWQRFTGSNPSHYGPNEYYMQWDRLPEDDKRLLLHPVEQVDPRDCDRVAAQLGLLLPTEAQWEYAARAGTSTPWWTGATRETLEGAANLGDAYLADRAGWPGLEEWVDDGFMVHAPVGSFRANPFGLHDTAGNVLELCRDQFGKYTEPVRDRDGLRIAQDANGDRVLRGGSFNNPAPGLRSSARPSTNPAARDDSFGLRLSRAIDP